MCIRNRLLESRPARLRQTLLPAKLIQIAETGSLPFVVSEHHVAINLAHFRDQVGNTQYGDSRPKVVGFLDRYRLECSVETDGVVAALP